MAVSTSPPSSLFSPPRSSILSSQTLTLTLPQSRTSTTRRQSLLSSFRPLQLSLPRSLPSSCSCSSSSSSSSSSSPSSSPLSLIHPFLLAEWAPILKGWLCSAAAVYCLSRTVPCVGRLPSAFSAVAPDRMLGEALPLLSFVGARFVSAFLQQLFLWEAALGLSYRIRTHIYDCVLARDLAFFEGCGGVPAGDIAYRITTEAYDVAETAQSLLNTIVPTMLQLTVMASQMVMISPLLSMVALLVIPSTSVIIGLLGQKVHESSREAHLTVAKLSAYLNEVFPSMLAVKVNNGEPKESLHFHELALDARVKHLRKRKMKALMPLALQALYIGSLTVFCGSALVFSKKYFDGAKFLSFLTALAMLIDPLQDVGKAYNEVKQGEPAIERLFDLTRFTHKVTEKPNAIDIQSARGDIEFQDITFRYGDNMPPVLDGVNLCIRAGEKIALIGPSGGGKTTLAKLLLRLYDPQRGTVLLDNCDIQDIKLRSLRKHIVLVSQDAMLFSGTVAENIGYRGSFGQIDMVQVENAARIANADEFIQTLPNGYYTKIGQRGSLLSGGQKQRLAIARTLYQNFSVLILDEATSALDSRSELLVRQALGHITANRTVLVIAHRLETILMADRIVMLEGGKLKEVAKSAFLAHKMVGLDLSAEPSLII